MARVTTGTGEGVVVTGGAGYIGSHTCVELLMADYDVIVVDNLCNSSRESLERVQHITGKKLTFYESDVCDEAALNRIFDAHKNITKVIHFAGLKAVGESVSKPLQYYSNNIISTLSLLKAMEKHAIKQLVFSSSATVYGDPTSVPIPEDAKPLHTSNPYGSTKLFIETILRDWCTASPDVSCVILRYFNPVGSHPSGLIGEDPVGVPNNLMPFVARVALGTLPKVMVFGNDYPTHDGTGVRDYIHIVDLAKGHLAAFSRLSTPGWHVYNLGLGRGFSVLEMIHAMETATGRTIPFAITGRRPGDIAACWSDCTKAFNELGWKATLGLPEMCADLWRWQTNNPNGYRH
ncbi:UDP-glucose 4-epimerase GalE [Pelomyxa schiedti]|nr:UDP-glucose 4-epimerase GalE [Pelomyxa schiedti]